MLSEYGRNFQNVARIANSRLIMQAYKFPTKFTIKCCSYSTSSMVVLEISENMECIVPLGTVCL